MSGLTAWWCNRNPEIFPLIIAWINFNSLCMEWLITNSETFIFVRLQGGFVTRFIYDILEYNHHSQTHTLPFWHIQGTATIFFGGGICWLPKKLNIMKLLFSFPSEIFSLKVVFGACLYFLDHYIHTRRHWKATIRAKWTFLRVCSYVCNDPEFETAYEQAPKTGFRLNIPLGKEKKSFICSVFGRIRQRKFVLMSMWDQWFCEAILFWLVIWKYYLNEMLPNNLQHTLLLAFVHVTWYF